MKRNDLGADEVVASGEDGRQCERMLAFVGNQGVYGPGAGVISRFCELDPNVSRAIGGSGCDVDEDWAFMRL
jgi:hypothetical protein